MIILAFKKIEISVNEFHFMRIFSPECFIFFSLPEETDLIAGMFLGSGCF